LEITLLGTGAPLAIGRRAFGILISGPGREPLLIDSCGGFELAEALRAAGIDVEKIGSAILTHQHLDHIGGMAALLFANRRVKVWSNAETRRATTAVLGAGFPEIGLDRDVEWRQVCDGSWIEHGDLRLGFFAVRHRVPTLAVRIEWSGGAVAISSDAAPCNRLTECASDAHLFVCDALCQSANGRDRTARRLVHCTAAEAAETAREAGVRRLVLTHLARFADAQTMLAEARSVFPGPVELVEDVTTFVLPRAT